MFGWPEKDERGPGKTAFYPLTVREDSKLTVIRPGGARGLHRPGEEVAVNRDKNKLSMASALIWKEEVVTEGNLGNIFHWTNHTRLGQIQEEKTQLAGRRETTQA